MAKYQISGNTVVRLDASAGGALSDISDQVDTISPGGGKVIQSLDVSTFADASERVIAGIEESQEFALEGPFDDKTPTGIDSIMGSAIGTILSFEINPVGTVSTRRKYTCEVLVTSYTINAEVKEKATYNLVLKQDGAMTIGAN